MDVPETSSPLPWTETPGPEHLLFAYGTLMFTTGIPHVDAALLAAGPSLGRGWIHGRLYDLGEYPGALSSAKDEGAAEEDSPKIWGHLMQLKDPAGFYSVIDHYEGFDAADPAASEFVRARTRVYLAGSDRGIPCQVYWYNLPIHDRVEITSGDYLDYRQSPGRPARGRIVS